MTSQTDVIQSKRRHYPVIHAEIPVGYANMLFRSVQKRFAEVEQLWFQPFEK